LGWVYYKRGLYSTAVRYLKQAVDKQPTAKRELHLGMCYMKWGDPEAGKKLVMAAVTKDPKLRSEIN
jgi:uncharacterized protein HemY